MANAKRDRWSYRTGEKGVSRVRAYEKAGSIFLEFYERTDDSTDPVRKRVSLRHGDRAQAKEKADELAAALRRRDTPQASTLTLHGLFYNWYLKEVTPSKSAGKQRHDATAAEMFCRCFGANRKPQTLSLRDWQKFISQRRSGVLRPMSLDAGEDKKPIRTVSDLQLRYDLKFLMAVLNFATLARDDSAAPLLPHNPLKGLAYPSKDNPRRPMLSEAAYTKMRRAAKWVHPLCEAFFVVVHETGHRAASVRHLRWSDLDLAKETVRWRAENDKIGFLHTTPLSSPALEALRGLQKATGAIGEQWVFPSETDPSKPLPRHTANKWWRRAESTAGLDHISWAGFHSARRKFASELKSTNLRDLAYMGGWKNPETVLRVYQQPDIEVQRQAMATRKRGTSAG